ncbi:hypothetical protein SELMODRAFT_437998 [Selaginella moellendorffii]|uniref:Uncharacterized protein n=1 Tax=Selaginella moellendorffii TaxID=88036 RepID=D8QSM9_SELML|nr:hypothetical protein SELMODRAFT_437998 [Selaginella moellendorffii]
MEESGLVEGGQATLPRDGRGVLAPDGIKRRTGLVDHGPRESISMTFCHSARLYALRSEYNLATCEALDRSRQHDEQRDTVGNTHRDSLRSQLFSCANVYMLDEMDRSMHGSSAEDIELVYASAVVSDKDLAWFLEARREETHKQIAPDALTQIQPCCSFEEQCRVTKCVKIALLYLKRQQVGNGRSLWEEIQGVRWQHFLHFHACLSHGVSHCGKASDESKTKRREDACHRNAHDSKSECKVYCGNELEKEAGELQMRREMEACHWKKSKAGDDRSESGKTSYELEKEVAAHHRKISQQQEFEQEVVDHCNRGGKDLNKR